MSTVQERTLLRVKRERVIMTLQPVVVEVLCSKFGTTSDQENFRSLCMGVESVFSNMYRGRFGKLRALYHWFDPLNEKSMFKQRVVLEDPGLEKMARDFMLEFDLIMEKSNFSRLEKTEWEIASSSKYLLNLEIQADYARLDNKLLNDFYGQNKDPIFDNHLVVYRRGVGIDRVTGFFFMRKLHELCKSFLRNVSSIFRKEKPKRNGIDESRLEMTGRIHFEVMERVHVKDVKIKSFFQRVQLQEPTFSQIIVLYRTRDKNGSIHIKHFKDVPMADMEIVLPETKAPRLSKWEWFQLVVSAVIGVVAFWETYNRQHKNHIALAFTILVAFVSYAFKVYITFHMNVLKYHKLISRAVYDRQLNSHDATLLHLCDFVIQQEVIETIIAYFVLLREARRGRFLLSREVLGNACNELIEKELGEKCDFEIDDALNKLLNLKLVTEVSVHEYECRPLEYAEEIIRAQCRSQGFTQELKQSLKIHPAQ